MSNLSLIPSVVRFLDVFKKHVEIYSVVIIKYLTTFNQSKRVHKYQFTFVYNSISYFYHKLGTS